jgi:murein L,D-transpeptidase YcbB/YkuD
MRVAPVLAAKKGVPDTKKKKKVGAKKQEKEKITSGADLFILYMTPWKNPNSIFVYFILIINILAKFNEAK